MAKKTSGRRAPDPITQAASRAATDLSEIGASYALVGGLAVSAWAEPRYTRDVDLAVGVADDAEAERVVRELAARNYEIVTVLEQTRTKRLATARLRRANEHSRGVQELTRDGWPMGGRRRPPIGHHHLRKKFSFGIDNAAMELIVARA
jgi:hypothetical protein